MHSFYYDTGKLLPRVIYLCWSCHITWISGKFTLTMAAKGIGAVPTVVDDAADHGEELDVEEERAWMKCVRLLMLNDPTRLLEFQRVVVTIVTKILDHPSDPKYRTLKTSNKTVKNKVLNTSGGAEFLLASGFILKREEESSCAIGSAPVHINGQDNDSSKIFYLPATVTSSIKDTPKGKSNNSSNQPKEPEESTINEDMVEKLTAGVEWLSSNVKILESFYESLSSYNSPAGTQSNKLCCECTIQVQLPPARLFTVGSCEETLYWTSSSTQVVIFILIGMGLTVLGQSITVGNRLKNYSTLENAPLIYCKE